ncbi:MAG TPA: thioesterase family protein [Blastocatellia bacterium]|jgi:4-hydroxybenzoyl-CoA thioesterase|nr:thioesterase family protein [Blastocatellia bacterium]
MAYRTTVPVRFGDVDKAGIVYYPRIFHYLHIAQEDFFAEYVGIAYHRLIADERIGFPTVSDSTNFLKALKYGDTLEIATHISRVGRSSVTFEFRIYKGGSNELLVRSSQVKVAVNMDTWEKVGIPEKYRAILNACTPEPEQN